MGNSNSAPTRSKTQNFVDYVDSQYDRSPFSQIYDYQSGGDEPSSTFGLAQEESTTERMGRTLFSDQPSIEEQTTLIQPPPRMVGLNPQKRQKIGRETELIQCGHLNEQGCDRHSSRCLWDIPGQSCYEKTTPIQPAPPVPIRPVPTPTPAPAPAPAGRDLSKLYRTPRRELQKICDQDPEIRRLVCEGRESNRFWRNRTESNFPRDDWRGFGDNDPWLMINFLRTAFYVMNENNSGKHPWTFRNLGDINRFIRDQGGKLNLSTAEIKELPDKKYLKQAFPALDNIIISVNQIEI